MSHDLVLAEWRLWVAERKGKWIWTINKTLETWKREWMTLDMTLTGELLMSDEGSTLNHQGDGKLFILASTYLSTLIFIYWRTQHSGFLSWIKSHIMKCSEVQHRGADGAEGPERRYYNDSGPQSSHTIYENMCRLKRRKHLHQFDNKWAKCKKHIKSSQHNQILTTQPDPLNTTTFS